MKKYVTLAVVASAFLLFASAYAQPIRIGVNLELSGRFAAIGNTSLQGIETVQEEIPEILGRPVELSVCDNQTTVEGSVACANRFVDEGVLAVLGPIATSFSIPAAEILQDAGIIMISTASTNPATTQIGEFIFRMAYTDDFQGVVAARYAFEDLGARTVAIFRQQDDDYSFGLAGFFEDEFVALGGEAVVVDYVADTVDFSAQIGDIRAFDADVIYFSGFCAEGAALLPQLRDQGFTQQVLAADASDDSQCPSGGGVAFDGVIFTGFGGPEVLTGASSERALEFETFFRVRNPGASDFNGFTLSGADTYNVMIEAIRIAGSTDMDAVLEALSSIESFPGVSGEITYAGTDGTPLDRTIGFFQYEVRSSDDWNAAPLFGLGTAE